MTETSSKFTGIIPESYDRGLGPVFFKPHAKVLADRVTPTVGDTVLELAAGTGILTNQILDRIDSTKEVTVTDLNEEMLQVLRSRVPAGRVSVQTADACALPLADELFDTVVCQFGYMFFNDKPLALRETFRVMRPGGRLTFNVWDKVEHHAFVATAMEVVTEMFSGNPPKFYTVPFGSYEIEPILDALGQAGFVERRAGPVDVECVCENVGLLADGLITGNPIAFELQELGPTAVSDAREAVLEKLTSRFGESPFSAHTRAIIFEARKQ